MVFVLEGFPVGVDRRQSDLGGVKGVDPQVGRAAGMGLFADVADQLAGKPVVSAARLSETAVLQQAGDGEVVHDRKRRRLGHGGGYYDRTLAGAYCSICGTL